MTNQWTLATAAAAGLMSNAYAPDAYICLCVEDALMRHSLLLLKNSTVPGPRHAEGGRASTSVLKAPGQERWCILGNDKADN